MELYFKWFTASKIMDFREYWTNIFIVMSGKKEHKKPNCQPRILYTINSCLRKKRNKETRLYVMNKTWENVHQLICTIRSGKRCMLGWKAIKQMETCIFQKEWNHQKCYCICLLDLLEEGVEFIGTKIKIWYQKNFILLIWCVKWIYFYIWTTFAFLG